MVGQQSFVFYDLETSGLNSQLDRIMQFAAIRTDLDLNPVGEPYDFLIRLSDDVLPSPGAIKVTGITPQKTVEEGYTEAEAAQMIDQQIFTPGTIAVGFNNIRFDDEFIRHLFWRNFYDPYEWAYKDGRSRWDLLDVIRFTRAVRPGNINWPVDEIGKATNRLELLSRDNNLAHTQAHDALSDVEALIGVAKMVKASDSKLWDYLLNMRDKHLVKQLVNLDHPEMFVYASGRFETQFEKVAVAFPIASSKNGNILVYNLRHNPEELLGKTVAELADFLSQKYATNRETGSSAESAIQPAPAVYFKELKYNRCPAVAPIGVLRPADLSRLGLIKSELDRNLALLKQHPELIENIQSLFVLKDNQLAQKMATVLKPVEAQLYDGFLDEADWHEAQRIRNLSKGSLKDFRPEFVDLRLPDLFLGYKARSFPKFLTTSETIKWQKIRTDRITQAVDRFVLELNELAQSNQPQNDYIVEELKLWLESVWPE